MVFTTYLRVHFNFHYIAHFEYELHMIETLGSVKFGYYLRYEMQGI